MLILVGGFNSRTSNMNTTENNSTLDKMTWHNNEGKQEILFHTI